MEQTPAPHRPRTPSSRLNFPLTAAAAAHVRVCMRPVPLKSLAQLFHLDLEGGGGGGGSRGESELVFCLAACSPAVRPAGRNTTGNRQSADRRTDRRTNRCGRTDGRTESRASLATVCPSVRVRLDVRSSDRARGERESARTDTRIRRWSPLLRRAS